MSFFIRFLYKKNINDHSANKKTVKKYTTKNSQFCDKIIFEMSQLFPVLAKVKIAQNI